jgi:preprotein translocase subunit SecA
LLDYDDVMNQQREVIYDLRLFALEGGEDLKGEIWEMIDFSIRALVEEYCSGDVSPESWDLPSLRRRLLLDFFIMAQELPEVEPEEPPFRKPEEVVDAVLESARDHFQRKIADFGEFGERVMSFVMLTTLDDKWKDHLYDLDHLKASISFRGWGQKDPLIEYKGDAYEMFVDLMSDIRRTVTSGFYRAQVGVPQQRRIPAGVQRLSYSGPSGQPLAAAAATGAGPGGGRGGAAGGVDELGMAASASRDTSVPTAGGGPDPRQLLTNRGEERKQTPVTATDEPGRNDPCPCGSGKKYKKCCGRNA